MKKQALLILAMFLSASIIAQKQANHWFFGYHAGLDFSNGVPEPISNSQIFTREGCSSISSKNGNLQFYTDGIEIWDKNGNLMPNGQGMAGHSSSTQSGVIVPSPGDPGKYFVFSVDAASSTGGNNQGLCYSLVDMMLNGGNGDVISGQKNILLIPNHIEKITAVGNADGDGTWVLVHKWQSSQIYAYLITDFGINTTPVISTVGEMVSGNEENAKGYMKVSPDGTKICTAHSGMKMIQIFDFNNSTGVVSNAFSDPNYIQLPYGVEFSPNSELLYVTAWKQQGQNLPLYQYDLTAGSPDDIINSRVLIAQNGYFGGLQLGPDNRVYVARCEVQQVGVINKPNVYGTDCDFELNGASLGGNQCVYGLPPFITSFFNMNLNFYYEPACFGDSTQFHENSSTQPDSVLWDFNDPASGSNNFSKLFNPKHLFTNLGFYSVEMKAWIDGNADSVMHPVVVGENPVVNLGPDTTFCSGDTMILDAGEGYRDYFWHYPDSMGRYFPADTSGTYWVEVANANGCPGYDTINITVNPSTYLTIDTTICDNEEIMIGGELQSEPGIYRDSLTSSHGCDSIFEYQLSVSDTFDIHHDLSICRGDSIFAGGAWQKESGVYTDIFPTMENCDSTITTNLNVVDTLYSYSEYAICEGDSVFLFGAWRKDAQIFADTLNSYMGCDSIAITELLVNEKYDIYADTMICEGDTIYLEGTAQTEPGTYVDDLQTVVGCDSTITTNLSVELLPDPFLGNDTTLPENAQLLLSVSFPECTYEWKDGSTDSTYLVTKEGTYYVKVTSHCGSGYDTIRIYYDYEHCFAAAPNAFTPNGDNLNDEFRITSDCTFGDYLLQVYDRWGKVAFESIEPGEGWNGMIKSKQAQAGTYVWRLSYTEKYFPELSEKVIKGTVILIR